MGQPIVVKYALDRAEFISGFRAYLLRRRGWLLLVYGALSILATGLLVTGSLIGKPREEVLGWVPLVAILALGMPLLFFCYWVLAPWRALKQFDSRRLPIHFTWRFTEEGIDISSDIEESKIDWKGWVAIMETRDHFLLFSTRVIFHILPKRGLSSPEDMSAFRELLKRKLGTGK